MPKMKPGATTPDEPTEETAPAETSAPVTKTRAKAPAKAAKPQKLGSLFTAFDDTTEHLNVLYWGREGSGKTSALAAATQLGKVLVINVEGGLKRHALQSQGINTTNLIVYPQPGEPITYDGILQAAFQIKADLMEDPNAWYLVVIDSITELNQLFTDAASDSRISKMEANGNGRTLTLLDQMFVDRSDYGVSTNMLRKLIRIFRDLPVHFAMTALERRDVDEDTSKVAYGPAVSPAIQNSILGYVDVVLYCKAADEDRPYFRALSKKVGTARAKDRLNVIPDVLVNPSFPRLVAYNAEELTEQTDPVQQILLAAAKPQPKPKAKPRTRRPAPAPVASPETTPDTNENNNK